MFPSKNNEESPEIPMQRFGGLDLELQELQTPMFHFLFHHWGHFSTFSRLLWGQFGRFIHHRWGEGSSLCHRGNCLF